MGRDERIALVHAELDGTLSKEQRAELARMLLADPQLRAMRDGLASVCNRLDSLAQVEPPEKLKDSILNRLPVPPPSVATTYRIPASSFSSLSRWRLAAMAGGLLVVGGVVFETMQSPTPASRETVGTIAAEPPTPVDSAAVGDDPVTGRAILYRDKGGLAVGLDLTAAEPVDVVISTGNHTFRINGLKGQSPTGFVRQTIALPGVGMQGQEIDVTFLVGGQTVSRTTLHAPAAP